MQRTLTKVGGLSLAVVIPKEFTKKLRWKPRQRVTISLRGRTIEIRDWKAK
jgi:antitoxin component of MazEF toxin-antitoxin module